MAAEALSRLIDKDLGPISPEEFIPIAEQTGMIHELGTYAFESVCRLLGTERLRDRGIDFIELNLSLYQLMREGLLAEFERICAVRRPVFREASDAVLELPEVLPVEEAIDLFLTVLESKVISK